MNMVKYVLNLLIWRNGMHDTSSRKYKTLQQPWRQWLPRGDVTTFGR